MERNVVLHAPITALYSQNWLRLVGEGPHLRILNHKTGASFGTRQVFVSQAIHGITLGSFHGTSAVFFLWGGHHISLVRVSWISESFDQLQIEVGPKTKSHDWIFDIAIHKAQEIIFPDSPDRISVITGATITAHDELLWLKAECGPASLAERAGRTLYVTATKLCSGPQSILYSSHLKWIEDDRILVAAGTAFGDIIIWSAQITQPDHIIISSNQTTPADRPVLHHIFTGHEGSIFGVRISPLLPETEAPCGPQLVLASCSDDRTIRIWDISEAVSKPGGDSQRNQEAAQRETGFGAHSSASERSHCLAVAWGHASRIWRVYFMDAWGKSLDETKTALLSVGEDATSQLWRIHRTPRQVIKSKASQDSSYPWSLVHTQTHDHHFGKNIWSTTLSTTSENVCQVTTGAADGKIVTYPISNKRSDASKQFDELSLLQPRSFQVPLEWHEHDSEDSSEPDSVNTDTRGVHSTPSKPDAFRSFDFVSDDGLVVTTNNGNLLHYTIPPEGGSDDQLQPRLAHRMAQFEDLKGFSAVAGSPSRGVVFVANSTGILRCYSVAHGMRELIQAGGHVTGLLAVNVQTLAWDPTMISLLLIRAGTQAPYYMTVRVAEENIQVVRRSELAPPSDTPVPRAYTSMLNVQSAPYWEQIILGGRNGTIVLHHLKYGSELTTKGVSVLHRAHGEEAVTAIMWQGYKAHYDPLLGSTDQFPHSGRLFSAGRDGRLNVRLCSFSYERNFRAPPTFSAKYTLIHSLALPFGPNVEGLYMKPDMDALFAYGFDSKAFVVHNLTNEQELLRIKCEGSHRSWAFNPTTNSQSVGTFAWTQAGKLTVYDCLSPSHRVIRNGTHGREIKSCTIARVPISKDISGSLVATGAEDTDIRLYIPTASSENRESDFHTLAVLRKHNTGIQQLEWSDDGRFLFSSGGFEEFFVWRIRPVPVLGIGVVCESECPVQADLPDLRITDFAVHGAESDNQEEESSFVICMVYSDSTVRIFKYSSRESTPQWELLNVGNYESCCLTQVTFIPYHGLSMLLTAATDGRLALWPALAISEVDTIDSLDGFDDPDPLALDYYSALKVHQNTIKTLAIHMIDPYAGLVVTGGDDNAIAIHLAIPVMGQGEHNSPKADNTLIIPRAHAAAVTAVLLIPSAHVSDGPFEHTTHVTAITAGIDQRVKVWDISIDLGPAYNKGAGGIAVKRKANFFTPVADVSSMALFPSSGADSGSGFINVLVCGVGMHVLRVPI